jgi:hypothetical protein
MKTRYPVILDILPHRIEPAEWAEAYDETHALLVAHPARLLGYDWTTIAGVPLPVYTRAIERDRDEPAARRWCIAGEQASLTTGEPQTMYRELGQYMVPASTPLDDILVAFALDALDAPAAAPEPTAPATRPLPAHPVPRCAPRVGPGSTGARVLGDTTSPTSFALPLLAAAMVIEARFRRWAMVHGDVDRTHAEAARRWAEGVLGRPIARPVRVDAWRLVERLGARFEGQELVSAVERLHLAPPETKDATLLGIFGRAEADPWWLGKLRQHVRPDGPGALRLLAAYLEATRDLGRLCGLACLDARGPRYTPEALMKALASLSAQQGGGLGRLDEATVEQALALVFGAGAGRLVEVLRHHQAAPATPAAPTGGPSGGMSAEIEGLASAEIEGLATLPSKGDLTPLQRERVHALVVEALARAKPGCAVGGLHTMATSLALAGPTLTEDAWDWITREQDATLVDFVTTLATLQLDAELGAVRRALFENQRLCRYALDVLDGVTR